VAQDRQDHSDAGQASFLPTAAGFDKRFSTIAASPGIRRVCEAVDPDLPSKVDPFSFVSVDLLGHVAHALALSPGQTLVDLGYGRGGPGCGWRSHRRLPDRRGLLTRRRSAGQ
jgi:hypothetical protein